MSAISGLSVCGGGDCGVCGCMSALSALSVHNVCNRD